MIAHPERYSCVQRDPMVVNEWYRMGCLFQVNRGSLLGRFGRREQRMAVELVDRGFATVVASDAHSARMRTPWMKDVQQMLSQEFAPVCAEVLLRENPLKILRNLDLPPVEPEWF